MRALVKFGGTEIHPIEPGLEDNLLPTRSPVVTPVLDASLWIELLHVSTEILQPSTQGSTGEFHRPTIQVISRGSSSGWGVNDRVAVIACYPDTFQWNTQRIGCQ